MRLFLTTIILLLFSINVNSQIENLQNFDQKKIHFGYFVGFNQYNYKLDYKNNPDKRTLINQKPGLSVGLIADLKLKENLNFRFEPGLYTNKSDVIFYDRAKFSQNSDTIRSIKSTYVHLPILLKYSAKRYNNLRPYILSGLSTSFNLSSNQNNPEDNSNGTFRLKTNTFYYELGIGIDFYLQYFKFSPSIRGVFSLKDELVQDTELDSPWTGNIQKMSARGIFLNLSFH
ncbi:PorT family protein [Flavobacteriaceae bacterium]|nr:PorT family protein [Flavobacteriaceae bacterium]